MSPILFILHAESDANHERTLSNHLAPFERFKKSIEVIRESNMPAGESLVEQQQRAIDKSDIVALLITPNFWEVYDLALYAMGKKKIVVPVLISHTTWTEAAFGGFRALPRGGHFIEGQASRDKVWVDVVKGLQLVWEGLNKGVAAATTAPLPSLAPLHPTEQIRILMVAANPHETVRLAVMEELRQIQDRLRKTPNAARFNLLLEPELRLNELAAALLRHRPHIVHFSGHGQKNGAIMLVDPSRPGGARPIDPVSLRELFRILQLNIHCVLMNACFSAANPEQAIQLSGVVGSVIGMDAAVSDASAIEFSASFYEALGFGRDIDQAFRLAKQSLATSALVSAQVPQLFPDPVPAAARVLL